MAALKALLIAERFRFYQRSQAVDTFLDQALRDRFVCGLTAEAAQKKLFAEANLSMTRALGLARGMEVAAHDAKELKHSALTSGTSSASNPDSHVYQIAEEQAGSGCHRCGKSDHDGWTCRFKDATCHKCGKTGHIAPVCRNGKAGGGHHRGHKVRETHYVEGQGLPFSTNSELGMYALSAENSSSMPMSKWLARC